MRVRVGSENPVKLEAARKAFSHYFKEVEVVGSKVESGVSEMPLTEEETIRGAINRVNAIFDGKADYYVGLEGGVADYPHGMFLFGWAAVLDSRKILGLGSSGSFLIPKKFAVKLRDKKTDLNAYFEKITKTIDIGKKDGAVGFVTKGVVTRTDLLERAVIFALAGYINPELYS